VSSGAHDALTLVSSHHALWPELHLLVERGTTLPSNLQGLYEVRHEGGKLDYESTMKLLKAFNDFRA
jgi:hypothetical protein